MTMLIVFLLLLAFFFGDLIFVGMLLLLGGSYLLACKYPERYKNRLRHYLLNVFAVFVSIFFVVLLIEVYLHLAKPSFLNLSSSIVGDLTDYHSRGVLPENAFKKPEKTFRILGLGDSFALCDYGLGKNYHNFLDEAVKAAGTGGGEVVNAGISGTGPGYYWHVLKKYGDLWKPDLVLVGFFVGNDFEEMNFDRLQRGPFIQEPTNALQRWWRYLRFTGFWLYQYSKRRAIALLDERRRKREVEEALVSEEGTFSHQEFLRVAKDRVKFFEKEKKAKLEALWKKERNLLLKFKEWCTQRQIPLVIAIFPDQFQVDRKLQQEIFQTYRLRADFVDLAYPNRLLIDYCRQNGIHYIDMLPEFQEQGESRELYRPRDTHWNEAGNRLAAELIFKYLKQHDLIPGVREAGTHATPRDGNL